MSEDVFAFEGNRMRGFLFGVLSFLMVLVDWISMDILHMYISMMIPNHLFAIYNRNLPQWDPIYLPTHYSIMKC